MRTMRIKRQNFDAIVAGRKTLEIRVGYSSIKRLSPGDYLRLESGNASQVLRIKAIRTYDSFSEMLDNEPLSQIMPGVGDELVALRILQGIYPSDRERLGVYAIEVTKA